MTTLTLNIPSKAVIAQQQGEETNMIPVDKNNTKHDKREDIKNNNANCY